MEITAILSMLLNFLSMFDGIFFVLVTGLIVMVSLLVLSNISSFLLKTLSIGIVCSLLPFLINIISTYIIGKPLIDITINIIAYTGVIGMAYVVLYKTIYKTIGIFELLFTYKITVVYKSVYKLLGLFDKKEKKHHHKHEIKREHDKVNDDKTKDEDQ